MTLGSAGLQLILPQPTGVLSRRMWDGHFVIKGVLPAGNRAMRTVQGQHLWQSRREGRTSARDALSKEARAAV